MRNPVTATREWWLNRKPKHEPEMVAVPAPVDVKTQLADAWKHRQPDEPLSDICLHDYDPKGGPQGQPSFGCHRGATSNRLLCGKHAAQHDRVKRDRARKKRARQAQRKARR